MTDMQQLFVHWMKQLITKREKGNDTMVEEFLLLGFKSVPAPESLLFLVFLVVYIITIGGNILVATIVLTTYHLHKPMYFFLGNLAVLETFYTSTILPRILASFISHYQRISFTGCFLQFYFFASLVCTECYLLSAMSYDRYLAICRPLHYVTIMNGRLCFQLSLATWITGFVASAFTTFFASQLKFCGPNEIDNFFCDYSPLLLLSCSDTQQTETLMSVLSAACTMPPLLLTMVSYVCIITTILKIPSTTSRRKAFSTCSSHLTVVTIFYGTLIIVYILPKTNALRDMNKVFAVFYTIVAPMVNPFIYSLRNTEFRVALRKAVCKLVTWRRIQRIQVP